MKSGHDSLSNESNRNLACPQLCPQVMHLMPCAVLVKMPHELEGGLTHTTFALTLRNVWCSPSSSSLSSESAAEKVKNK